MNPVKALYRAVVPPAVRESVARKRFALWRWATGPGFWGPVAGAYVTLGRPVRPVRTRYGVVFADLRDRGVGRPLFIRSGFEPGEVEFVRSCLRPGMTFLDIGANVGCFTVAAASAVGPGGRVVAVEPDPHNFELLRRGVGANALPNVTLLNVAAGAEPGVARLYRSGDNLGDHRLYSGDHAGRRAAVEVPVARLDDLFAEHRLPDPDVIKIDVQGYEEFVFRGATRLLGGGRPLTVLAEFWPHGLTTAGGDPDRFLAVFRDRGFACRYFRPDGKLEPVAWEAVREVVPPFDPGHPDHAMVNLVFARG